MCRRVAACGWPSSQRYSEHADAQALAALLLRCRDDAQWLAHLRAQCALRAPLFAPAQEAAALHSLVLALTA
jgi:hypothetical protein